jgi:hypothetical protein
MAQISGCSKTVTQLNQITGCTDFDSSFLLLIVDTINGETMNIPVETMFSCMGNNDFYLTAGTYNSGYIYFSGVGTNFAVDVNALLDDTNTFITGATLSGDTFIMYRNDGVTFYTDFSQYANDFYLTAGTYSNGYIYFSGNGTNFSVDVNALLDDTNTYVTGATLSGDTLILGRNDGYEMYVDFSKYNTDYYLTAGTYSAGFLYFSGNGTNFIVDVNALVGAGVNTYVTGGTINGSATNFSNQATIGLYYHDSDGIPHLLPFEDTFATGATLDGNILTIVRNDGYQFTTDLSSLLYTGACINDLYVNNIHGCLSAVTLYNSFKSPDSSIAGPDNSFSFGSACYVSGNTAFAFGSGNTAIGDYTFVIGEQNSVIAHGSFAAGYGNDVTALYSASFGGLNIASGLAAFTCGRGTTGSGILAFASGWGNVASGGVSFVEGGVDYNRESGNPFSLANYATHYASHAAGAGTLAAGYCSYAGGYTTIASGETAYAVGKASKAYGDIAFACGWNNIASGVASFVEGGCEAGKVSGTPTMHGNLASAYSAHAAGAGTVASGMCSYAGGYETVAGGEESHAEGIGTVAYGYYSTAFGFYTKALGVASIATGIRNISYGSASHTEGGHYRDRVGTIELPNQALSYSCHAEGAGTVASGQCSHSENAKTVAAGDFSHAQGNSTTAWGSTSHSQGMKTYAYGSNSHAEGEESVAVGQSSHAGGVRGWAEGGGSYAAGFSVGSTQYVIAKGTAAFNHSGVDYYYSPSGATGEYAFILGGLNHTVFGQSSGILGGEWNRIYGPNSVIIGGLENNATSLGNTILLGVSGLTAVQSATTYVNQLVVVQSYTPNTTSDPYGVIGQITWDSTYAYVKTTIGWGRTKLDYGF